MDILDFLRSDGSIVVNKKLAHRIGLNEAVVYSELVSLFKYWDNREELTKDGYFYCTYENLVENTAIKEKTLQRTTNRLVKLNLIKKEQRGLPAKTHYKITNGIYNLFNDISNKDGQNVRTDDNNGFSNNNDDKQPNIQGGQNVRTSKDKKSKQDKSNSPTNNTNSNNTVFNNTKDKNEEEELSEKKKKNIAYSYLNDFLNSKGIDQDTINQTIKVLINENISIFTIDNVEKQYSFMMDKLKHNEVDNHNNFAVYFANGLKMRSTQMKASKQHQEEELKEIERRLNENKKRDTSIYFNWLEEE